MYAAEFRRLAGITQVATVDSKYIVHNRLTHVLEVAQVGQRLSQHLLKQDSQREIAEEIGGVDADVVEAACLAHDLGHPPFGHVAEYMLHKCAQDRGLIDGFEGNAQSFRIVTKLAVRRKEHPGLDLSRATLNALLKYPWKYGADGKKQRKWGAYETESEDFAFARESQGERKSAEAELMDWADDIAYSVNDMADFYQVGLIPLDRLFDPDTDRPDKVKEIEKFLDEVKGAWETDNNPRIRDFQSHAEAFRKLVEFVGSIATSFDGTRHTISQVRELTSVLIDRYLGAIELTIPAADNDRYVKIDQVRQLEITMLKELTWHYVIRRPSLATQQHGQQRIIEGLFEVYYEAARNSRMWQLFPARFRDQAKEDGVDGKDNSDLACRLVCDLISGLSEQQAVEIYQRLHGIRPGISISNIL